MQYEIKYLQNGINKRKIIEANGIKEAGVKFESKLNGSAYENGITYMSVSKIEKIKK